MTDEKWLELSEFYQKEFPNDMPFEKISAKLDKMSNHPDIQTLRKIFCDDMILEFTEGYVKYTDKLLSADNDVLLKLILDNIEKLSKESFFYWAFYYYVKKDYKKCKGFIRKVCRREYDKDVFLDETGVLDLFLVPFKNAPKDIWDCITEEVKAINTIDGVPEFCELISLYYRSTSNDEVVDALFLFIQKYPDYKTPNEMLGYTYYNMSMWNNAIACFEKVEEQYYFYMADIYWMLDWASGKVKNYGDEEMYYRKSLELAPNISFALNNLGYCLYKQKKYREALEIFDKCLKERPILCR